MHSFIKPPSLPKFPFFPVLAIIVLTLISFMALWGAHVKNISLINKTLNRVNADFKIFELQDAVLNLDKLSNAAFKMYILTNNETWGKKYQDYEAKIFSKFQSLENILSLPATHQALAETRKANNEQRVMESQARILIQQGKKHEAHKLIFSPDYTAKVLAYELGMDKLTANLREDAVHSLNIEIQESHIIKILIGLCGLMGGYIFKLAYQRLSLWRKIIEQTSQDLLISENRYRDLMEHASCGIFIHNSQGLIINVNKQGENLLGLKKNQIIGKAFSHFVADKDQKTVASAFNSLLTEGRAHQSLDLKDIILQRNDHSLRSVYLSLVMIPTGNEHLLQIITTDVTEIHQLKSQTMKQERLSNMGILAAGIAHEVNNPLAWMLGNLDLLKRQIKQLGEPPYELDTIQHFEEVIDKTLDGAQRVSELVHNFKDLSRGDESTPVSINLHEILNKVIDMISLEIKYRGRLEKTFAPNLPLVKGIKGKLHQVFLNLLINALHSLAPERLKENVIHIITGIEQGQVYVKIRDTGSGIAPEVMPHIFDLFFTTKPIGEGTGCGLFICHDIVTKMHGHIEVESQVGEGSTFSIYLPQG